MYNLEAKLKEFIAIPSISAQPKHKGDCERAAKWLEKELAGLGMAVKLIKTAGNPVVVAQREGPMEWPRVVIYGHYDVQPPEPFELWKTPPFVATQKGKRLYGRGAADNKGPMLALVAAVADTLEAQKDYPVRLTFVLEGEEEIGSKHLPGTLEKLKELKDTQLVLVSDTDSSSEKRMTITTGVRGITAFEIKVKAIARDLHSGDGGAVPNPIRELSRLVAGVFDKEGLVNIPGFYKGITPPSPEELKNVKACCKTGAYAKAIGAKGFYRAKGRTPFEMSRFFPSFEINGIKGGYQGDGSKTIIPAEASAKITCRIAAGQNPHEVRMAVFKELKKRLNKLYSLEIEIHEAGSPAYAIRPPNLEKKAPKDSKEALAKKAFAAAALAIKEQTGNNPEYLRLGGTIHILAAFKRLLGADSLMVGLFTHECALHSPNESALLPLLANGREVWGKVLAQLAEK